MAITMLGEVSLSIEIDRVVTYGDVEAALLDAGITDYTIVRNGASQLTAIQIAVRSTPDSNGIYPTMDALQTMTKLRDVIEDLDV